MYKINIEVVNMKYTANLKVNLTEIKLIRTLVEVELSDNMLKVDSLDEKEYNELLKQLLKKIQRREINILEDVLEG